MGDTLTKSASRSDTAQKHIANNAVPMLSIVFVDQVYYHFHHDILFLCSAFGNHERKGDEGAVGDAFGTILTVENAVVVHKPKEEGSCNAFVTVTEGMVLGDEIE